MTVHADGATDWIGKLGPAPSRPAFIAFTVGLVALAIAVLAFDFVPLIDHVNLAFHEAGHPIFGLLGNTMGWLGGTLGQCVFPLATTFHFLRRQQLASAAVCAAWGFENLRNIAVYVADARTQALPLVGGGQHDWGHLLGQWGLLQQDTRIAGLLIVLCWSGWLALWWIMFTSYRRGADLRDQQRRQAEREALIARARANAKRDESERNQT